MADPQKPVVAASTPTAVVPPVVAVPAPAIAPIVKPSGLSVIFSAPTWQSTKPDASKRLADVQLLGMFSGLPSIALAGITIAQEHGSGRSASSVLLYMPSASRVGAAKAVTARMSPATQTLDDGTTETVMVPNRAGERQIAKLTEAIIDAWADANIGQRNPYGVELPLDLRA